MPDEPLMPSPTHAGGVVVKGRGATLREHVGIAARVLNPTAVSVGNDHGVDNTVEEIAIVADKNDGAGVAAQHFLEHVEGLEVEARFHRG